MENSTSFESRMPTRIDAFLHPRCHGLWPPRKITLRMTKEETDLLLAVLKQNSESPYLEFGAGGSTLLAAGIVPKIVSIENDLAFINLTRRQLMMRRKRSNPSFLHIDQGPVGAWGFPQTTEPARLSSYAETVWKEGRVPSGVKTVLVDGRFRRACLLHCALHLDPSVDILLHDAARYNDILSDFFDEIVHVDNLVLLHVKPDIPKETLHARLAEVQYDPN